MNHVFCDLAQVTKPTSSRRWRYSCSFSTVEPSNLSRIPVTLSSLCAGMESCSIASENQEHVGGVHARRIPRWIKSLRHCQSKHTWACMKTQRSSLCLLALLQSVLSLTVLSQSSTSNDRILPLISVCSYLPVVHSLI